MSLRTRPAFRRIVKSIVLLVVVSFICPYLTWAFDQANFMAALHNSVVFNQQPVRIPDGLGTITRSYQGENGLVIYVQDLHCNVEVQKNIAGLISHMAKQHGLSLVAVEGASSTIHVGKLATFPNRAVRKDVGQYFLKEGKMTGPEYYAAVENPSMNLRGIENEALYQADRESIREFLNEESQGGLYDLKEALDGLKDTLYNPALKAYDRHRVLYQEGKKSLLNYCEQLYRSAKKTGCSLTPYPELNAYVSKRLNVFPVNVDSDQLFREMDQLDRAIRNRLYRKVEERNLDVLLHRVDIMERILNISATPAELGEYRKQPEAFKPEGIIRFLQHYTPDGDLLDSDVLKLNDFLKAAGRFYQVADQRSLSFVDNTLGQMASLKTRMAVLVTGGYHSDQVLDELQRRHVSFIAVKPRLTQVDLVNPYYTLLRERKTPLEKLLAQNQNIFGLPSNYPVGATELDESVLPDYARTFMKRLDVTVKKALIVNILRSGVRGLGPLKQAFILAIQSWPRNNNKIQIEWENARANESRQAYLLPLKGLFTALVRLAAHENPVRALAAMAFDEYEVVIMDSQEAQAKADELLNQGQAFGEIVRTYFHDALASVTSLGDRAAFGLSRMLLPLQDAGQRLLGAWNTFKTSIQGAGQRLVLNLASPGFQSLTLAGAMAGWVMSLGLFLLGMAVPALSLVALSIFALSSFKVISVATQLVSEGKNLRKNFWLPIGRYDAELKRMVDPTTGLALFEAPWYILAHEQYAHRWVNGILDFVLRPFGQSLAGYQALAKNGKITVGYVIWYLGVSEILAHLLDWIAAPLALVESLPIAKQWTRLSQITAASLTTFLLAGVSLGLFAAGLLSLSATLPVAGLCLLLALPLWLDIFRFHVLRSEQFLPTSANGIKNGIHTLLFQPGLSQAERSQLRNTVRRIIGTVGNRTIDGGSLRAIQDLLVQGFSQRKQHPELWAQVDELYSDLMRSDRNVRSLISFMLDDMDNPALADVRLPLALALVENGRANLNTVDYRDLQRILMAEYAQAKDANTLRLTANALAQLGGTSHLASESDGRALAVFCQSQMLLLDRQLAHSEEQGEDRKECYRLLLFALDKLVENGHVNAGLTSMIRLSEAGLSADHTADLKSKINSGLELHYNELEPLVAAGEKVVIDHLVNLLQPGLSTEQRAVLDQALVDNAGLAAITDVLLQKNLPLNQRAAYLVLQRQAERKDILKALIENPALDMNQRLYAFNLYTARHAHAGQEADFRALADSLAGEGDALHAHIQNMLGDQARVDRLNDKKVYQNEDLKVYIAAVWADTVRNHPGLPLEGFEKIAQVMSHAEFVPYMKNAYASFKIGGQIIQEAKGSQAAFLMLVLAHELGHNILMKGLGFNSDSHVKGVIHEYLADALAKSFAGRYVGSGLAEFEQILKFQEHYEEAAKNNFASTEVHADARALQRLLESWLKQQKRTLSYPIILSAAFQVLSEKTNWGLNLRPLFQRILGSYSVLARPLAEASDALPVGPKVSAPAELPDFFGFDVLIKKTFGTLTAALVRNPTVAKMAGALLGQQGESMLAGMLESLRAELGIVLQPGKAILDAAALTFTEAMRLITELVVRQGMAVIPLEKETNRSAAIRGQLASMLHQAAKLHPERAAEIRNCQNKPVQILHTYTEISKQADQDLAQLGVFQFHNVFFLTRESLQNMLAHSDPEQGVKMAAAVLLHESLESAGLSHQEAVWVVAQVTGLTQADLLAAAGLWLGTQQELKKNEVARLLSAEQSKFENAAIYHQEPVFNLRALAGFDSGLVAEVMMEKLRKSATDPEGTATVVFFRKMLTAPAARLNRDVKMGFNRLVLNHLLNDATPQQEDASLLFSLLMDGLEGMPGFSPEELRELHGQLSQVFVDGTTARKKVLVSLKEIPGEGMADFLFESIPGDSSHYYFREDFLDRVQGIGNYELQSHLTQLYLDNYFQFTVARKAYGMLLAKDQSGTLKHTLLMQSTQIKNPQLRLAIADLLAQAAPSTEVFYMVLEIFRETADKPGMENLHRQALQAMLPLMETFQYAAPQVRTTLFEMLKQENQALLRHLNTAVDGIPLQAVDTGVLGASLLDWKIQLRLLRELGKYDQEVLKYLAEVAANDTWNLNLRATISANLAYLVGSKTPEPVLDFFLGRLETAENQIQVKAALLESEPNLDQIRGLLTSQNLNPRTGLLIIKQFQGNEKFLLAMVEDQALPIRFRLYAFNAYLASHPKLAKEEFQRLHTSLDGVSGQKIHDFISQLFEQDKAARELVENPWLAGEEAKILATATNLDIIRHHPKMDERVATQAYLIAHAVVDPWVDNFDSFYQLGGQFMARTNYSTSFLLLALAHENGHNRLLLGLKFPPTGLRNIAIHEYVADAVAKAFAKRYDRTMEEYERVLQFEKRMKSVAESENQGYEGHEIGRAEDQIIREGFRAKKLPFGYQRMVNSLWSVLQEIWGDYLSVAELTAITNETDLAKLTRARMPLADFFVLFILRYFKQPEQILDKDFWSSLSQAPKLRFHEPLLTPQALERLLEIIRQRVGSIFYHFYVQAKTQAPQNPRDRWLARLGEPLIGAPSWEWAFALPGVFALGLSGSWLAAAGLLVVSTGAFSLLHPGRTASARFGLFALGLTLGGVALLPMLTLGPSLLTILYGVGLNIVLHSLTNFFKTKAWEEQKEAYLGLVQKIGAGLLVGALVVGLASLAATSFLAWAVPLLVAGFALMLAPSLLRQPVLWAKAWIAEQAGVAVSPLEDVAVALLGDRGQRMLEDIFQGVLTTLRIGLQSGQTILQAALAAEQALGNVIPALKARLQVEGRSLDADETRGRLVRDQLQSYWDNVPDFVRSKMKPLDPVKLPVEIFKKIPAGVQHDTDLDQLGVFHFNGRIYITEEAYNHASSNSALAAILLHEALEEAGLSHQEAATQVARATESQYPHDSLVRWAGLREPEVTGNLKPGDQAEIIRVTAAIRTLFSRLQTASVLDNPELTGIRNAITRDLRQITLRTEDFRAMLGMLLPVMAKAQPGSFENAAVRILLAALLDSRGGEKMALMILDEIKKTGTASLRAQLLNALAHAWNGGLYEADFAELSRLLVQEYRTARDPGDLQLLAGAVFRISNLVHVGKEPLAPCAEERIAAISRELIRLKQNLSGLQGNQKTQAEQQINRLREEAKTLLEALVYLTGSDFPSAFQAMLNLDRDAGLATGVRSLLAVRLDQVLNIHRNKLEPFVAAGEPRVLDYWISRVEPAITLGKQQQLDQALAADAGKDQVAAALRQVEGSLATQRGMLEPLQGTSLVAANGFPAERAWEMVASMEAALKPYQASLADLGTDAEIGQAWSPALEAKAQAAGRALQAITDEFRNRDLNRLSPAQQQAFWNWMMLTLQYRFDSGFTFVHAWRVGNMAAELARIHGEDPELYRQAGWAHDLGKLLLPRDVLYEPHADDRARALIRSHARLSEILLSSMRMPQAVVHAAWHHEWLNGTGYPAGLAGASIPDITRAITVADAYDASTSFRPYENANRDKDIIAALQADAVNGHSRYDGVQIAALDQALRLPLPAPNPTLFDQETALQQQRENLGYRAGYLLLQRQARHPEILRGIIADTHLDMDHRLYAFSLAAQLLPRNDEHALRELAGLLGKEALHNHITRLMRDDHRVSRLLSESLFRNEELRMYTAGVWADVLLNHPELPAGDFQATAWNVAHAVFDDHGETANMFFAVGVPMIRQATAPASFLILVLAHELMHNILIDGLAFPTKTRLRSTVHEFLGDVLVKAMVERYGNSAKKSLKEYERIVKYDEEYRKVTDAGMLSDDAHTSARALDCVFRMKLQARGLVLDYGVLLTVALSMRSHWEEPTEEFFLKLLDAYAARISARGGALTAVDHAMQGNAFRILDLKAADAVLDHWLGKPSVALLGLVGEDLLVGMLGNVLKTLAYQLQPGEAVLDAALALEKQLGNIIPTLRGQQQVQGESLDADQTRGPPVRDQLNRFWDKLPAETKGQLKAMDPRAVPVEILKRVPGSVKTDSDLDRLGVFHLNGRIYMTQEVYDRLTDEALAAILLHEALEVAGLSHDAAIQAVLAATDQHFPQATLVQAAGLQATVSAAQARTLPSAEDRRANLDIPEAEWAFAYSSENPYSPTEYLNAWRENQETKIEDLLGEENMTTAQLAANLSLYPYQVEALLEAMIKQGRAAKDLSQTGENQYQRFQAQAQLPAARPVASRRAALSIRNALLSAGLFAGFGLGLGIGWLPLVGGVVFGVQIGLMITIGTRFNLARLREVARENAGNPAQAKANAQEVKSAWDWIWSVRFASVENRGIDPAYTPYIGQFAKTWFRLHEGVEWLLPFRHLGKLGKVMGFIGDTLNHLVASLFDPLAGIMATMVWGWNVLRVFKTPGGDVALTVSADSERMSEAAAEYIAGRLNQIIAVKGKAVLGLVSGSTPQRVYELWASYPDRYRIDWSKVEIFHTDEFVGVSQTDKASRFYQLNERLFKPLGISQRQVHFPNGMGLPAEEAKNYEAAIAKAGGIDIQLAGIGQNGHIAGIEPGVAAYGSRTGVVRWMETSRQASAQNYGGNVDAVPEQGISMGLGTMLDSGEIVMLASGEEKAVAVAKAMQGPITRLLPASVLRMHKQPTMFLDEAAARGLNHEMKRRLQTHLPTFHSVARFLLGPDEQGWKKEQADIFRNPLPLTGGIVAVGLLLVGIGPWLTALTFLVGAYVFMPHSLIARRIFLQRLRHEFVSPNRGTAGAIIVYSALLSLGTLIFFGLGLIAPFFVTLSLVLAGVFVLWGVYQFFKLKNIIAMDGWDQEGKQDIAMAIAEQYGYTYVDVAVIYRSLALKALTLGLEPDDLETSEILRNTQLRFELDHTVGRQRVFMDGREITQEVINTQGPHNYAAIVDMASRLGKNPAMENHIKERLLQMASLDNLVVSGQNVGNLLDKQAKVKIYVAGDLKARAERLLRTRLAKEPTLEEMSAQLDIIKRKEAETRKVAPVRPPSDALIIDTTRVTHGDAIAMALTAVDQRATAFFSIRSWWKRTVRPTFRMFERAEGMNLVRSLYETWENVWVVKSDVDNLSKLNLFYSKKIVTYLLEDINQLRLEGMNKLEVRKFTQGAIFVRDGGDEATHYINGKLTYAQAHYAADVMRDHVASTMRNRYRVLTINDFPAGEAHSKKLDAIAAELNLVNSRMVRVTHDVIYGTQILLRVDLPDMTAEQQIAALTAKVKQAGLGQVKPMDLVTRLKRDLPAEDFAAFKPQDLEALAQGKVWPLPTISAGFTRSNRALPTKRQEYIKSRWAKKALTRAELTEYIDATDKRAERYLKLAKAQPGKNSVAGDNLKDELPEEIPVGQKDGAKGEESHLDPRLQRLIETEKVIYEDNPIVLKNEKNKNNPLFDGLVPWALSSEGLHVYLGKCLRTLQSRTVFEPQVFIARAPPDVGPDKIQIVVVTPERTSMVEMEGRYFGERFVQFAFETQLLKAREENEKLPEDQRLSEQVLEEKIRQNIQSYFIGQEGSQDLFKFSAVNNLVNHLTGDEMILAPQYFTNQLSLQARFLKQVQTGQLDGAIKAYADASRQDQNLETAVKDLAATLMTRVNVDYENLVKIMPSAVFTSMDTREAMKNGVGRLFQEIQIAGLGKSESFERYRPELLKNAREVMEKRKLSALVDLLNKSGALPDAVQMEQEKKANLAKLATQLVLPFWDKYASWMPQALRPFMEELIFRVGPLVVIFGFHITSIPLALGIIAGYTIVFIWGHQGKNWSSKQWAVAIGITLLISMAFFGLSLWATPAFGSTRLFTVFQPAFSRGLQPLLQMAVAGIMGLAAGNAIHYINNFFRNLVSWWPELTMQRELPKKEIKIAGRTAGLNFCRRQLEGRPADRDMVMGVGVIDSYPELNMIYGTRIASFLRDKTMQVLQTHLDTLKSGQTKVFSLDTERFGVFFNNANQLNPVEALKSAQEAVHTAFHYGYTVTSFNHFKQTWTPEESRKYVPAMQALAEKFGGVFDPAAAGGQMLMVFPTLKKDALEKSLRAQGFYDIYNGLFPSFILGAQQFNNSVLWEPTLSLGLASTGFVADHEQGKKSPAAGINVKEKLSELLSWANANMVRVAEPNAGWPELLRTAAQSQPTARGNSILMEDAQAVYLAFDAIEGYYHQALKRQADEDARIQSAVQSLEQKRSDIEKRRIVELASRLTAGNAEASSALRELIKRYHLKLQAGAPELDLVTLAYLQEQIRQGKQQGTLGLDWLLSRVQPWITKGWEPAFNQPRREALMTMKPKIAQEIKTNLNRSQRLREYNTLQRVTRAFCFNRHEVVLNLGGVKDVYAIFEAMITSWNRHFAPKDEKDFTPADFSEENLKLVQQDLVRMRLQISQQTDLNRMLNDYIGHLKQAGYAIKEIKGKNVDIQEIAPGQYHVTVKSLDAYTDVKIVLAPNAKLQMGGEIQVFTSEVAPLMDALTRREFVLGKHNLLRNLSWLIAINGEGGPEKYAAARLLAGRINYRVLDIGFIFRAVVYAAQTLNVDTHQPEALAKVLPNIRLRLNGSRIVLVVKGESMDITDQLRFVDAEQLSEVSKNPNVINYVRQAVQKEARQRRLIVVGRNASEWVAGKANVEFHFGETPDSDAGASIQLFEDKPEEMMKSMMQGLVEKIMERGMARTMPSWRKILGVALLAGVAVQGLALLGTLLAGHPAYLVSFLPGIVSFGAGLAAGLANYLYILALGQEDLVQGSRWLTLRDWLTNGTRLAVATRTHIDYLYPSLAQPSANPFVSRLRQALAAHERSHQLHPGALTEFRALAAEVRFLLQPQAIAVVQAIPTVVKPVTPEQLGAVMNQSLRGVRSLGQRSLGYFLKGILFGGDLSQAGRFRQQMPLEGSSVLFHATFQFLRGAFLLGLSSRRLNPAEVTPEAWAMLVRIQSDVAARAYGERQAGNFLAPGDVRPLSQAGFLKQLANPFGLIEFDRDGLIICYAPDLLLQKNPGIFQREFLRLALESAQDKEEMDGRLDFTGPEIAAWASGLAGRLLLSADASAYLNRVLGSDASPLARELRNSSSSISRAFVEWARNPNAQTETGLTNLLLDRMAPGSDAMAWQQNLATANRFSNRLSGLSGVRVAAWDASLDALAGKDVILPAALFNRENRVRLMQWLKRMDQLPLMNRKNIFQPHQTERGFGQNS